jgi:transcription antitermination factor NusG
MPLDIASATDYMPANKPNDRVDGAWHVVQTEPWREFQARDRIAELPGLHPWLPTEVYSRQITKHGRPFYANGIRVVEEAHRAFFPGYLLVHFDANEPHWAPLLRWNPQLRTIRLFVSSSGQPLPLPHATVAALEGCCRASDGAIDMRVRDEKHLAVGASVRLLEGCPFEGLAGTVRWTDQRRVEVLLGLLRVTVERRYVA